MTDLARAQAFFGGLFGWEFKQFMETMVVFGQGAHHIGGLAKVDSVSPASYATVWFRVESIEAVLALTPRVGGSVTSEKKEVPHVGWSATIADPDGNPVGVVEFGPS